MMINQDVNVQELDPTLVRRGLQNNPMGDKIHIDESGQLVMPDQEIPVVVETVNDQKD